MIMASSYTNNIVLAFLLLICGIFYIESTLTSAATVRALIAPISYDAETSLYTLTLATPSPRGGGPLLLELDNSNLWVDCVNPHPYSSPSFKPVLCNNTKACTASESCSFHMCVHGLFWRQLLPGEHLRIPGMLQPHMFLVGIRHRGRDIVHLRMDRPRVAPRDRWGKARPPIRNDAGILIPMRGWYPPRVGSDQAAGRCGRWHRLEPSPDRSPLPNLRQNPDSGS